MRAARLHAVGDLRVADEPVPDGSGPGMRLVRVTAVGICGSDLHGWDEGAIGDAKLTHPLVLGHEGAGVIAEGPRAGQRVAIDPAIPCETCRACRDGYRNLCYRLKFSGHGDTDGMMREFMAWPTTALHPLPDRVSDADGAMLEPLGVAIHSVDLGHLPFGGTASVIGCGPIGGEAGLGSSEGGTFIALTPRGSVRASRTAAGVPSPSFVRLPTVRSRSRRARPRHGHHGR